MPELGRSAPFPGLQVPEPLSAELFALEEALARQPLAARPVVLDQMTRLFLGYADSISPDQLALFDRVLLSLSNGTDVETRTQLANGLADVVRAPRQTILRLAGDEIVVARPLLVRSAVLRDEDLVSIAVKRGRDHMLAITERARLAAPVTDVLIARGDRVVVNAVAGNPGAALSDNGVSALIEQAARDEPLLSLLRLRRDLAPRHLAGLAEMAMRLAQSRLAAPAPAQGHVPRQEPTPGTGAPAAPANRRVLVSQNDLASAARRLSARLGGRLPGSAELRSLLERGEFADAICVLAAMAGLAPATVHHLIDQGDHDSLFVIGRKLNFDWAGLVSMLGLLAPALTPKLPALERSYEELLPGTADQALRFMRLRESAAPPLRRRPR